MDKKEYAHTIHIRTRYSETDQMGFVYYGRFAEFYEIGRVETIRSLGMAYKQLEEEQQVLMPVMSMQVRYLRPALYDQELAVKTMIRQVPEDAIVFFTEIYNESLQLINAATIKLCFLEATSKKRVLCPMKLQELIAHAIQTQPSR